MPKLLPDYNNSSCTRLTRNWVNCLHSTIKRLLVPHILKSCQKLPITGVRHSPLRLLMEAEPSRLLSPNLSFLQSVEREGWKEKAKSPGSHCFWSCTVFVVRGLYLFPNKEGRKLATIGTTQSQMMERPQENQWLKLVRRRGKKSVKS